MIYELVKKQHEKFGLLYKDEPRHLSEREKKFYCAAIAEELSEYIIAQSMEDEYDAILDILVFTIGALLRHGFPVEGIEEVVRANMAKELGAIKGKRGDFQLDLRKPADWKAPNLVQYLTRGVQ